VPARDPDRTMNDRNLVRGLYLGIISLAFGLTALKYPIGDFSHAGPGLFPLMVSSLLLVIGIAMVVRSRFVPKLPMNFQPRNISLIIGSLCGFAVVGLFINMIAGIVFMVFVSGFAASTYSVSRNIKVSLGLIAVAFAFQKLLGLNLPLY
jgi:hypothetical protein